MATRPNTGSATASNFLAGAQGAFAAGRFFGVGLMWFIKPRWIFLAFQTLVIIFLAPAITQRGDIGVSMLFVVLFFESICFPTIVALGMKGLGRHSKRGSGWIVGGVIGITVGAAVFGNQLILGLERFAPNLTPEQIASVRFSVTASCLVPIRGGCLVDGLCDLGTGWPLAPASAVAAELV